MNELQDCILGDLVEFQRGYDLPKDAFVKGEYPVQSSNGILGYHNEYKVKAPGITIGRSGTVGIPHLITKNFFPHNTALYVKDFKGNNVQYIYYLLKNLKLNEYKTGSGVPTMNRNHLHPLKIRAFTDLKTQQSIVAVLSALDKKIALNKQINARLEEMAKTLYDYWFVQFDFPDANSKPYKSSGGEMVFDETLKREIPKGWEVKSLWKIAKYFNGLALQKYRPENEFSDFFSVIKIREMNEGISSNTERASTDIPKEAIIDDGDILFSWSATLEIKIWSQGKGALNQHIFKVTSAVYPKYFYYFELLNYLKHFKMIADLRKTTMGHITQDHLKQAYICIPSNSLLERLEEIIEPIFQKILIMQKQNHHLT
ncbi:restriction endonuclease subunit S [Aggregatibacter actinomycetemcomitans]|uniref:restriction endonuclease subunit S n=1 Tax=Aggregatibacter actinomycetemcomitans TaxID=714 RepID=UPI001E2834D5|nr:restriction endonuclease subunit S [Aggregatibacter actinomycetemcomitans]